MSAGAHRWPRSDLDIASELRRQQLNGWLLESGKEATQLQRDLTAAREVIGNLERQLDLARSGEQAPVAEEDVDTVVADEEIH